MAMAGAAAGRRAFAGSISRGDKAELYLLSIIVFRNPGTSRGERGWGCPRLDSPKSNSNRGFPFQAFDPKLLLPPYVSLLDMHFRYTSVGKIIVRKIF